MAASRKKIGEDDDNGGGTVRSGERSVRSSDVARMTTTVEERGSWKREEEIMADWLATKCGAVGGDVVGKGR